eukprot:symbB.v1.2.041440.t1/scaffold8207.1/size7301/1
MAQTTGCRDLGVASSWLRASAAALLSLQRRSRDSRCFAKG